MEHFDLFMVIAAVLFGVGGAMRLSARAFDGACVAFGLMLLALAYLSL